MKAKRKFFSAMLAIFIGSGLLGGCGKKNDPINQAEKKDKDKPGIAETKAIAKEAYIG